MTEEHGLPGYKYPWQEEWYRVKDQVLADITELWTPEGEFSTITSLDPIPIIDRRTTFPFESVEEGAAAFALKIDKDIYLRLSNPTIRRLEGLMTLMEGRHFFGDLNGLTLDTVLKKGEIESLVFGSGMGAISHTLLALLEAGDTMITDNVLYGCTDNLLLGDLQKRGIKVVEVDSSDLEQVTRAFRNNPEAKLIYFETIANPTLKVTDIRAISKLAKMYHALVVVDNTFPSPYLLNPLRLGADIVIHSLTKYVNGHADALGGSATGPANWVRPAPDKEGYGALFNARRLYGSVIDPQTASLIYRGAVTLPLRMKQHCDNAEAVVELLRTNQRVEEVYYPESSDMRRQGGMVGFKVKGGLEETARVVNRVRDQLAGFIAVSLGAPFTLFDHAAGMTHFYVPPEQRARKGIQDNYVRCSIGLEDKEQLLKLGL